MIKVIRFTASWCQPCKSLAPIIVDVQREFPNIVFETIDVDENREMASSYNIRSVPTVVVENNGSVTEVLTGVRGKSEYVNVIKKWSSN